MSSSKSRTMKKSKFPQILMEILSMDEYSDIIAWVAPENTMFKISQPQVFESVILPKHFKQATKIDSFQRKLKRWGFKRIKRGIYFHELFQKDRDDLLHHLSHDEAQPSTTPAAVAAIIKSKNDAATTNNKNTNNISAGMPPNTSMLAAPQMSNPGMFSSQQFNNNIYPSSQLIMPQVTMPQLQPPTSTAAPGDASSVNWQLQQLQQLFYQQQQQQALQQQQQFIQQQNLLLMQKFSGGGMTGMSASLPMLPPLNGNNNNSSNNNSSSNNINRVPMNGDLSGATIDNSTVTIPPVAQPSYQQSSLVTNMVNKSSGDVAGCSDTSSKYSNVPLGIINNGAADQIISSNTEEGGSDNQNGEENNSSAAEQFVAV